MIIGRSARYVYPCAIDEELLLCLDKTQRIQQNRLCVQIQLKVRIAFTAVKNYGADVFHRRSFDWRVKQLSMCQPNAEWDQS